MAEQNPQSNQDPSPEDAAARSDAPDAPDSSDTGAAEGSQSGAEAGNEPSPEEALDAAGRAANDIQRETGDDSEDAPNTAAAGSSSGDGATAGSEPLHLENFDHAGSAATGNDAVAGLSLLDDIDLQVTIELGRTRMYIEDVLRLNENSVVELDKAAGDSVDIFVNDRLVARGEVLVLNENFCVRINEIISQQALDECEAAESGNR